MGACHDLRMGSALDKTAGVKYNLKVLSSPQRVSRVQHGPARRSRSCVEGVNRCRRWAGFSLVSRMTSGMQPIYLEHFALNKAPFDLAPQGDFLFSGLSFRRALESLRHIVSSEPVLTVVTGEVGVGKTLLAKVLLSSLPENASVVFLENPTFSRDEILQALAEACAVPFQGGKRQALAALQQAAIEQLHQGRRLTILIDEAHLMPPESVEEVRLLTNLEHAGQRLFGIILIGQPELKDELLARHDLRQVRDRVKYWIEMSPMPIEEVGVYLDHRLRHAGWQGGNVFPPKIARAIWRASGGRPRRINLIADRCLLAAYLADAKIVTEKHLARALAEIGEDPAAVKTRSVSPSRSSTADNAVPSPGSGRLGTAWRALLVGAAMAMLAVVTAVFLLDYFRTTAPDTTSGNVQGQASPPPGTGPGAQATENAAASMDAWPHGLELKTDAATTGFKLDTHLHAPENNEKP